MEVGSLCGVFGTFLRGDAAEVEAGLDRLAHRGPDGRGLVAEGPAVHGHVRLSLVDLSDASAQPFRVAGGLLSFVGEVWNHRRLRAELEAEGIGFRSTGDTEVLAEAVAAWGLEEALGRLDGMFAFAWSSGEGTWLARDRFGKVPLYALREGKSWTWSSERKALGRRGGLMSPVPPGSTVDLVTGQTRRWARRDPPPAEPLDAAGVLRLLRAGVRRRLSADAPVCCLVSGGLDSSLVLLLAKESGADVAAFTATLDPEADDLRTARRLCKELGVKLCEAEVPALTPRLLSEAVRCVEVASKAQCEIAVACVPLARAVRAEGFKACLSGEAADELFGGYGNTIIRAARLDDLGWRVHRLALLEKMSRGNFVRCNKAFMAGGVECRLPFMERGLVEGVLALGKRACPPGKGLLKEAARLAGLPAWVVDREKDTFQGGSGVSAALLRRVHDPLHFIHAEARHWFGRVTTS